MARTEGMLPTGTVSSCEVDNFTLHVLVGTFNLRLLHAAMDSGLVSSCHGHRHRGVCHLIQLFFAPHLKRTHSLRLYVTLIYDPPLLCPPSPYTPFEGLTRQISLHCW